MPINRAYDCTRILACTVDTYNMCTCLCHHISFESEPVRSTDLHRYQYVSTSNDFIQRRCYPPNRVNAGDRAIHLRATVYKS